MFNILANTHTKHIRITNSQSIVLDINSADTLRLYTKVVWPQVLLEDLSFFHYRPGYVKVNDRLRAGEVPHGING